LVETLFGQLFSHCAGVATGNSLGNMISTFWSEHNEFSTKTGKYDNRDHIWTCNTVKNGETFLWHKMYSLRYTDWFGKFACRVSSKILGIGSAERNWGAVKHLKTDKRSHLSSSKMSKQATIFGASCAARAKAKHEAATKHEMDSGDDTGLTFWDESNFDWELGFDMFHVSTSDNNDKPRCIVNCWFEPWEDKIVRDDSDAAYNRLLAKYRGLQFIDLDPPNRKFKIDNELIWNDVDDEWCIKCISSDVKANDDKSDIENGNYVATWAIRGSDVYDCLYSYYTDHSNLGIVAVKKGDNDDKE